ncbi:MAG: putative sugar nucleotidyl transferase [Bacteroidota bacterium]
MTLCLFEDGLVGHLAPLALTRAAFDLRVGARTLADAALTAFPAERVAFHTRPEVNAVTAEEHPSWSSTPPAGPTLFVNGRWLVRDGDALSAVRATQGRAEPHAIIQDDTLVALWHPAPPADASPLALAEGAVATSVSGAQLIERLWDLIDTLGERIADDLVASGDLGHIARVVQGGAVLVGRERIHVAATASVKAGAVLSAEDGPIWIGPEAVVGEHAVLKGPVYLGPKAVVKPGARIDTSVVGFWSKVGGEVHGSVVHSLSSKAHDGYLGNSYLGRWCNLGAGTNTSNLKNDYGEVTIHDAVEGSAVASGRQFAGLFMGDHSKCSIHTMFNTGTVVGVFCNLFGADFPPRHVPSFSWGGAGGFAPYRTEKAFRVAEAVMSRRNRQLSSAERQLLGSIAEVHHGTIDPG